jgi:hypothetical protein
MNYRVPREPSTPRIAVWRTLKRLGVIHLGDGLVGLPHDSSTKESLEWVANSVIEAGGEATIWIATPTIARWTDELAERMRAERAAEYEDLIDRVRAAAEEEVSSARTVKALRSELRRIERRDHFPPDVRTTARRAVRELLERSQEETRG